ncbi:MAG: hypothetical protein JW888_02685 [Pirellulales bacterium]|nr:hypothetical protein [Pirellulales bacterium]
MLWQLYRDLMRLVQRMQPEEYLMLLVMGVALGFYCLRGFGSRTRY